MKVKKIVFLVSQINIGDMATSNSIFLTLSKEINIEQRHDLDANQDFGLIAKKYSAITNKDIVFAVGEKAMALLHYLNQNKLLDSQKSYIAASIHQYDDNIKNLPLDYIALPEIVLDSLAKKTLINSIKSSTLTFTVPTSNPSIDELKIAYDNWNIIDKPKIDNDYIIVMLPGDAPDSNNKIQYFTKQSAKLLFDNLEDLWQRSGARHKIILHNGPRTGRYDENSGELSNDHESDKLDKISEYFVNLLESSKMESKFFNFYFENGKPISVFNQLLYLAQLKNQDNYFILPGESVSMLGQIPLYVNADKAIVFKSSSMNQAHELVFDSAINHHYLSYFATQGEVAVPIPPVKREHDDVWDIVHDVVEGYELVGRHICDIEVEKN